MLTEGTWTLQDNQGIHFDCGLVFIKKRDVKGVRTHMLFKPVHNGNRKRYSYARIKEVLKMPHLIDLQRKSYEWFIRRTS